MVAETSMTESEAYDIFDKVINDSRELGYTMTVQKPSSDYLAEGNYSGGNVSYKVSLERTSGKWWITIYSYFYK